MDRDSTEFLHKLLETPSPSGFEVKIQSVIKKRVLRFADSVTVDTHGNLIAAYNPDAKLRVMLAGHCDQIGLMVTHIDDNGYLYFAAIGGVDATVVPGSRVIIHTRTEEVIGVIGVKAIHLVPSDERNRKLELKKLWIDIGAKDGKEAKGLVAVGDPITFELGVTQLGKHRIAAAGCDDRVGAFIAMEVLRNIASRYRGKRRLGIGIFAVSTVQEELGLRGARTSCWGIDPVVGIAIDVTHASDHPTADPKEIGTVKLGLGPTIARGANINPVLGDLLENVARKKRIPFQTLSAPNATGTDANAMQISRAGVAAALIGIPNRYMHTQVETVDLRDVDSAIKLITEGVVSITPRKSFIPV